MNTQRPEWNDANNALAGYGLSTVTLYHLRRYLAFMADLLDAGGHDAFEVSREVRDFFAAAGQVLENGPVRPGAAVSDADRQRFMERMGAAADTYRDRVYAGFDGARERLDRTALQAFVARALELLDDSIRSNRREDGLYHAYNLLRPEPSGHAVEHLQEMLEGQAAVLRSGVLDPAASLALLDSLRASRLYRADQQGYLLYPVVQLPAFLDRNRVPAGQVAGNAFLRAELESGRTRFIERDAHGEAHFNGRFRNAAELRRELRRAEDVDAATIDAVCAVFESVFGHRRFTGRSGAMYKYEGIGCIYWHMVSKLLLAVGEVLADAPGAAPAVREGLLAHYAGIKAGLGATKSPADYGAFPTDPYSHTPGFAGVQQPGMTGQVKEDIISRFAELGVRVEDGRLRFEPRFLRRGEFGADAGDWRRAGAEGEQLERLEAGTLAFTLCGVPVVYRAAQAARIRVHGDSGEARWVDGAELDPAQSAALFGRDGAIHRIEVEVDSGRLAP